LGLPSALYACPPRGRLLDGKEEHKPCEPYHWDWTYLGFHEYPAWELEINFGSNQHLWNLSGLKAKWAMNGRLSAAHT
jgi:hypothetical protein